MQNASQPDVSVALVIGGGSGMGADAARALAEAGHEVGVMSSSGKGEALGQELGGLGFTGSNQSPADLESFIQASMARWGRVDVLVNGAGHGPKGPLLEISDEDWHAGLDVYLLNIIRATRLVAPIMAVAGGGSIINLSSFAVARPDPDFPTSAVFRAGLSAYTTLFAAEHAAAGVRMNNVLPGFIDSLPATDARTARIPAGRYGTMREVSAAITFLASPEASYITGQELVVDGGLTTAP